MSDYLVHHGILGQKWGIRRYQNSDGSLTPEGRERYGDESDSNDQIEAVRRIRESDLKNASILSDEDLQNRIGRLEKEKKFRELTESEVMPGKAEAKKIFKDIGKQTITTVGTRMATGLLSYGGKLGGTLIGDWLATKGEGYAKAGTIISELGQAMWYGGPKK